MTAAKSEDAHERQQVGVGSGIGNGQAGEATRGESYHAAFTVITSRGSSLTKRFTLHDGEIRKTAAAQLTDGTAERIEVASVAEFAAIHARLEKNQALTYGTTEQARARIVTKARLSDAPNAIARDRKHFAFAKRPGVMMFDHDPGRINFGSGGELRAALIKACPVLEFARMLWCPSASSYIYNRETGIEVQGLRGQRLYMLVADASDIPRAGSALAQLLCAVGYAYAAVSKAGTVLDRTIIDASVYAPERLDFAAGADCVPPLEQRPGGYVILEDDFLAVDFFDTRLIPDPTPEQQDRAATNRAAARADVDGERRRVRAAYIEQRGAELAAARGIPIEQAHAVVEAATDRRLLFADIILHPEKGEPVAVGEVLDNPARWHGTRFADPLEPSYAGDQRIAWVNLRSGGRPYLYSHAHGGQRFELIRQPATLKIQAGELPRLVDEALAVMKVRGDVFDHGPTAIVRVADGRTMPVTPGWLSDYLGRCIRFEQYDKRSKDFRAVDAPERLARAILERSGERGLPRLNAVITAPTMRLDGTALDVPGFDAPTGLLYINDEPDAVRIPRSPTPDDAVCALLQLFAPFGLFPFVDAAARGAMLAAVLSACVRRAISTCPAFAFDAPAAGSGKTLLARCVAALAGGSAASFSPPRDDEEVRKILFAELRQGAEAVIFDNVPGAFGGPAIDQFVTEPLYAGRILGVSESVALPNRALLLVTGNNIAIRADTVRRVLVVRIDPKIETPYTRAFEFDPLQRVRANRLELVTAGLTILRAYVQAGSPRMAAGNTASFEDWDRLVRQAVCWIAAEQAEIPLADPILTIATNAARDDTRGLLRALLQAWAAAFGEQRVTAAQVLEHRDAGSVDGLAEALDAIEAEAPGVLSPRRLGKYLARHRDELAGGLRLEGLPDRDGVVRWRVAP